MPGRKEPEEERRRAILRAAYTVAARERLTGLTARAVAAEAGVSSGLVFFYFGSIEKLQIALLDWLLERAVASGEATEVPLPEDVPAGDPAARLIAIIAHDVRGLPRQRDRVELFFDFWVLGTRRPVIRRKISLALARLRASFVPLAQAVIDAESERWAGTTAEGLANVVTSFLRGCSLQLVTNPTQFDVEQSLAAIEALVRHPVTAASR
jgi:AcrR family transcriptional regulator